MTTVLLFVAGAVVGYVARAAWRQATVADHQEARREALKGRRKL